MKMSVKQLYFNFGKINIRFPYLDFLMLKLGVKKGMLIQELNLPNKMIKLFGNALFLGTIYSIKFKGGKAVTILISKHKIPKLNKNHIKRAEQIGKFLGYPDCCIKQFIKDIKKNHKQMCYPSIYSTKRFLKQCNKKEKNKFGVHLEGKTGVSSLMGFIPCSPKCKKANLILKRYYDVSKILLLMVGEVKIPKKYKKQLFG